MGIIGLGQIGSSLMLGLKGSYEVYGFDLSETACAFGEANGIEIKANLIEILESSEIVFLAVPSFEVIRLLEMISDLALKSPIVLVDMASTKLDIETKVLSLNFDSRYVSYVGIHPLAGNERPSFEGAELDLFRGRTMVVSSGSASDPRSSLAVAQLIVHDLGSRVIFVNPAIHDRVTNFTIQLPHVFAYLTSSFANEVNDQVLLQTLSGNSFAGVTRVARSSPVMVGSFLYSNREILRHSLVNLSSKVDAILKALDGDDAEEIIEILKLYSPAKVDLIEERFAETIALVDESSYHLAVDRFSRERYILDSIEAIDQELIVSGVTTSS